MTNKRASNRALTQKKSLKLKETKACTGSSKMTMCTISTITSHAHCKDRRADRRVIGGKRVAAKNLPGKIRAATRRSLDPCDNSNDSGLGFDHHVDHNNIQAYPDRLAWSQERSAAKRQKLNIKVEDDEINDNYSFPDSVRTCKENNTIIRSAPPTTVSSFNMNNNQNNTTPRANLRCTVPANRSSQLPTVTLTSQFSNVSRYADISLTIVSQPEQQHRARYQTEGSRGAVKDRTGNGFPIVQLNGYDKPATLQVFIGTDVGKATPHMFYQACRVSGKNSTPCIERKIEGTVVIELQLDPSKEMVATCDCVGILKERNVDVEHRFPEQTATRSKKKSTRCRMVFRTTVTHDNGVQEVLQICSQPIACTQPPGVPEISKKSLTSCPASGGLELFILGKNFLKDTRVFFQQVDEQGVRWEQSVVPDKEYLQQTHLVCVIPPYLRHDIIEPVTVRLFVVSSGKTSEPHQFVYTPTSGAVTSARDTPSSPTTTSSSFLNKMIWSSDTSKQEQDMGIMPPPGTNQVPLSQRRASTNQPSSCEPTQSPPLLSFKQELIDENSQSSVLDPLELHRSRFRQLSESSMDVNAGDSNVTMITENSMDILRHNSLTNDSIMHNENSNISIGNENSMDVMVPRNLSMVTASAVRDDTAEPASFQLSRNVTNFKRGLLETPLSPIPPHNPITTSDLNVIDLRMKLNTDPTIGLTSTTSLHNFSVPTATALPAQSAQSVENYLSSIESPGKKMIEPPNQPPKMIPDNTLATTLLHDVSTTINQALNVDTSTVMSIKNGIKLEEKSLTRNSVSPAQTVAAISTGKLAALMNSVAAENQYVKNEEIVIHRPQDILLPNKSPHQVSSTIQTQNIMTTSQDIMLSSFGVSSTPLSLHNISPDVSPHQSTSATLSPEVILNSQTSPTLMSNGPVLTTDTQLGLCPPVINADSDLSPLLTNDPTKTLATHNSTTLATQLSSVISSSEPEKAILLKAAVDLFETQKKITALEPTLSTTAAATTMEEHIINDILTTKSTGNDILKTNMSYVESQISSPTKTISASMSMNMIASKAMDACTKQQDMITHTQSEGKPEDRMIPHGFATMTDNELINIINPSCFDQV
ncbi:uncharacterized protein LOC108738118 isoform X2 [Agrilus planipennis]|uniref:Nuclear factor of activated T-cells 5 n=1 Tax=Agrilus planipennis TaxID=224129 RepID=A0A7F5R3H7_AGRPL|nr:uncharacterized protein LOC108738118 isoform X2 [Agrilus planipennis]